MWGPKFGPHIAPVTPGFLVSRIPDLPLVWWEGRYPRGLNGTGLPRTFPKAFPPPGGTPAFREPTRVRRYGVGPTHQSDNLGG